MASLAWLLIPLTAAVVAGVWGSWAGRRRTGIPDADGVAGYERFRAAMERPRVDANAPADDAESGPTDGQTDRAPALTRRAPEGPARAAD